MNDNDYRSVLLQMTLEEKASLCSGLTFWLTQPLERLGVPSVWVSDGPHGIRKEKQKSGTNIMKPAETATCFPTSATTAGSWDTALMEEIGAAIAEEAKAYKVTTVLGPGVNIKRSPLCGRNFEYISEDPFLSGRMGAAFVRGVQKNGVGVSLKHFCANNQEHLRMSIDTIVDERALREIYLAAFEYIVKTEQPATVMCSYNRLNGTYLSDNKRLLTDILRGEWGFEGIVVSDWGAVNDRVEGIRAGLDLEMPGNKGMNDRLVEAAVRAGAVGEEELDRVVLRLLKFAFERKSLEGEGGEIDFDAHHALARRAAAESAVLLKNEGGALPVSGEASIAVVGALAEKIRYQGSGSSHINPPKTVAFTQALREAGRAFDYAPGYSLKGDGYSERLIRNACETARGKDAVIVFAGLTDDYESEGFDRGHMNMPKSHDALIGELVKVNKNVIVVLSGGSPVAIPEWESGVGAILNLYLGGQAGGEAAYDLIFGAVNPSGKLAETYPFSDGDALSSQYFSMGPRTVEYRESVFVGYRYFDTANKPVRYPFGYGLSYTRFEYSELRLSARRIREGDALTVSFKLKNIGDVAGAEAAQLYVADVESEIFRPAKELKGFKKVFLKPGEEALVELPLDSRAFAYYNTAIKDWHVESGSFDILVGASSRDIRLAARVEVDSAQPGAPVPDFRKAAPEYYDIGGAQGVSAQSFSALYGAPLEENLPYEKGALTVNNSVEQLACGAFGRFLCGVMSIGSRLAAIGTENPAMIVQSVKDLPLRSFSGFTEGRISMMSVYGLLDMCNGTRGGFRKFCAGFRKKNK